AAIPALRETWQRQTGLTGFESPPPGIGAGGLTDYAPFELLVTGILKPVDENNHLTGRRVNQAYIRWIEPPTGERAHRQRLELPEGNDIERVLALARILGILMPDA